MRIRAGWTWTGDGLIMRLSKGVLISIDPDAHSIEGYDDTKFGVLAAQKGGLTKERNLSSFSLTQFEEFLSQTKKLKGSKWKVLFTDSHDYAS